MNQEFPFPCNCGHSRMEHTHIPGDCITYCKRQWSRECACDTFTPLSNLEYIEYKYDKKIR